MNEANPKDHYPQEELYKGRNTDVAQPEDLLQKPRNEPEFENKIKHSPKRNAR